MRRRPVERVTLRTRQQCPHRRYLFSLGVTFDPTAIFPYRSVGYVYIIQAGFRRGGSCTSVPVSLVVFLTDPVNLGIVSRAC